LQAACLPQILSLRRSIKGCGDDIEQLNVGPDSQHKLAGFPSSAVQSTSIDKLLKRLIPSQLKREFRIICMEGSEYQRRPYTIGIASEVKAMELCIKPDFLEVLIQASN
jgi:hypothetical protein